MAPHLNPTALGCRGLGHPHSHLLIAQVVTGNGEAQATGGQAASAPGTHGPAVLAESCQRQACPGVQECGRSTPGPPAQKLQAWGSVPHQVPEAKQDWSGPCSPGPALTSTTLRPASARPPQSLQAGTAVSLPRADGGRGARTPTPLSSEMGLACPARPAQGREVRASCPLPQPSTGPETPGPAPPDLAARQSPTEPVPSPLAGLRCREPGGSLPPALRASRPRPSINASRAGAAASVS